MCYSDQAWQDYRKFQREFGPDPGIKVFVRLFWNQAATGSPYKIPKAMMDAFADAKDGDERKIRDSIEAWKSVQAPCIEQEFLAQKTRLVGVERALQTKVTKKAQNDQRIATDKFSKATLNLRTCAAPRRCQATPASFQGTMQP